MSNVLEFVVKLTDMMSGGMKKVSSSVQQSFKGMIDASNKFNNNNLSVTRSLNGMSAALDRLHSKRGSLDVTRPEDLARLRLMNTEIRNLERNINKYQTINGSRLKTWANDAMSQIPGAGLLRNPLVMAGTAAAYSVKQAMDVQASKVKFGTLMGNDAMGDYMYNQLKGYADKTPYSKDDTLKSGETLLNYGVGKTKVMPIMSMLGDISGGSAERLQSLSLAFGQVYAKGHLAGQELLQMVNAGFNPLQAISEKTGKSMNELDKMMSAGKITVDMVTQAMQSATGEGGRFHGMMNKLGNTLQGRISTFMDKLNTAAAKLGNIILPVVNKALDGFNFLLSFISENGPAIATVLGTIGTALFLINAGTIAESIGLRLASTATNLLSSSFIKLTAAMLANPITWIVAGVVALVAAIKYAWDHFESFRKVVLGVWEVMKNFGNIIKDYVINRITELLNGIVGIGRAIAALFSGDFSKAWDIAKDSARQILGVDSANTAAGQIAGAYGEGAAKGSASWQASQEAKYRASLVKANDPLGAIGNKAWQVRNSKELQKQIFGSDTTALNSFLEATRQMTKVNGVLKLNQKGSAMNHLMLLQDMMERKGSGGTGSAGGITPTSSDDGVSRGIVAGGPRTININGVKFADKIEIHAVSTEDGINQTEHKLAEMYLRVLNSGASVQ